MSVAFELDFLQSESQLAEAQFAASSPEPSEPAEFPTVPLRPRRLYDAARPGPEGFFTAPLSVPARRRSAHAASDVVTVLRPPSSAGAALRLTRRGVVVLALAIAALGLAVVWVAAMSAPAPAATPAAGPAVVTVHPGDTLWSIASRVAPQSSPAAEVATLQHLNHIGAADLVPGEHLRVR